MNYEIVSTKRTSAIFLAIVLLTGTIALSFSSSSFMTGVEAQAQPYYGEMDNKYNSYGPPEYPDNNRYNSYGPSYGMNNDKKSYGNDNSYDKSQYRPFYKPDYKPKYQSYDGKDDKRDKSKKDSKNVDITKIKCINTNININGNNTGNVSIGNKDAEEGYLGAYSSDGEGYDNKQGKGIDCIINNNNNNINIIGGGNVTDGNQTEPRTCEECFRAFLTETQISAYLAIFSPTTPITLDQFCFNVESGLDIVEAQFRLNLANPSVGVSMANIDALIACLKNVGIEFS